MQRQRPRQRQRRGKAAPEAEGQKSGCGAAAEAAPAGRQVTTLYKLVLPEHLNQYGFLFGGNLLKWIDEVSWMASLDFPATTS